MSSPPAVARLYARGFFLAPQPVPFMDEIPHYHSAALPGHILYLDELSDVATAVEGEDWVVVVGKAWPLSSGQLAEDVDVPSSMLGEMRTGGVAAVERALYDVAGRYALLARVGGKVFAWNDAAGTRSVFFNASQQQVASHYDMLERSASEGRRREPFGSAVGVNLMLDLTRHSHVEALIANHRLELSAARQVRFHGSSANPTKRSNLEERLGMIEQLWREQLDRLVMLGHPVVLSMSGGLDSRTMLAMARHHKSRFRSFTYTSETAVEGSPPRNAWERVMVVDHQVTQSLSEFLPERHTVIVRRASTWPDENKATLSRNSTHVHGRWLLPAYLGLYPDPRTVHYRGNLFEIGRSYWGSAAPDEAPLTTLSRMLQAHTPKSQVPSAQIDALVRSRGEHLGYTALHADHEVGDMAYWEFRHSRWYSQVLNETDTAFDTVTPINVRRILDIFLSFPVADREKAWVQRELIYRNHSTLLFQGINEPTDLYQQFVAEPSELQQQNSRG